MKVAIDVQTTGTKVAQEVGFDFIEKYGDI